MTENTRTQLATSEARIDGCYDKAVAYQHAALKQMGSIKSEVGALFYLSLVSQNQDKLFAGCDDAFIALLQSHNSRYAQNMGLAKFLGGFAIGAYAVDGIVDSIVSSAGSSSTTQITGSRVVSGSGNSSKGSTISASGEGLGQANTFNRAGGNNQSIGGFQPRTNPVQTESIDTNQPQSASGENAPTAPTEGADDGASITPVEGLEITE
jgi:hypothetical protein